MARTDPQLNFRIPTELRDKLTEAAKANNRSMTGELIARLEDSFKNTIQATMPPAQGHLVSRSSLPTIHLSKDGKSQEISLHDLARAIASDMQKNPD